MEIITNNAIIPSNFFPYLSIKVDVIGVKNIEDMPKEPIKIPISYFWKSKLSRNKGRRKKDEKFIKKRQLAKVDNKNFLFRLNI